jgi:hypothetical protein
MDKGMEKANEPTLGTTLVRGCHVETKAIHWNTENLRSCKQSSQVGQCLPWLFNYRDLGTRMR